MAAVGFGVLMVLSTDNIECEEPKIWRFEPTPCLVCLPDAAGDVLHGGYSAADGLYAKSGVIKALLSASTAQNAAMAGSTYIVFAVFAMVMSLIGAFYYLRVVKSCISTICRRLARWQQLCRQIPKRQRVPADFVGHHAANGD